MMSVCVAWVGTRLLPYPADNARLGLIALARPRLSFRFEWAYLALWTSAAFLTLGVLTSVIYICAGRVRGGTVRQPLPPYPRYRFSAASCSWFSGNATTRPRPVPRLRHAWLTIPERSLYTGVA